MLFKKPNVLFAIITIIINLIIIFLRPQGYNDTGIFLVGILLLLALLAIDARSLNYITFNKKEYKRQAILVADFIGKSTMFVMAIVQFFVTAVWIYIVLFTLSVIMVALYFIERKWLIDNAVYDNSLPNKETGWYYVLISQVSYILSVSIVALPNYRDIVSYLWLMPLILMMILYVYSLKTLKYDTKRIIMYCGLYVVSLTWFIIVRYVMSVESLLTIFTVIGVAIMMPLFSANAKKVRKMGSTNNNNEENEINKINEINNQ